MLSNFPVAIGSSIKAKRTSQSQTHQLVPHFLSTLVAKLVTLPAGNEVTFLQAIVTDAIIALSMFLPMIRCRSGIPLDEVSCPTATNL